MIGFNTQSGVFINFLGFENWKVSASLEYLTQKVTNNFWPSLTHLVSVYACVSFFWSEILCTEKNSGSKLCRQVESMRQQLEEIPQLRKMLREQSSLLEKTNKNVIAISRSLQDVRDSQPKEKVRVCDQISFLFFFSFRFLFKYSHLPVRFVETYSIPCSAPFYEDQSLMKLARFINLWSLLVNEIFF